jgi:hypothetical protein
MTHKNIDRITKQVDMFYKLAGSGFADSVEQYLSPVIGSFIAGSHIDQIKYSIAHQMAIRGAVAAYIFRNNKNKIQVKLAHEKVASQIVVEATDANGQKMPNVESQILSVMNAYFGIDFSNYINKIQESMDNFGTNFVNNVVIMVYFRYSKAGDRVLDISSRDSA